MTSTFYILIPCKPGINLHFWFLDDKYDTGTFEISIKCKNKENASSHSVTGTFEINKM